jgi:hypothetical protein
VSITDNLSDSPQSISLLGIGAQAVVSLGPPLNFGDVIVGTTSSQQIENVINTGDSPLIITSISVTGANSGDFAETNNCGDRDICMIGVTFIPTATGNRSAAVTVTDNAAGSPQSFAVYGVGTPPLVYLSVLSLSFGSQAVGTTSPPQIVQLSASAPIKITKIATSAKFAETNTCGGGPVRVCQISVTFTPSAPGVQNGTLAISDNGSGSPQTVSLSGTGTAPVVALSPKNLNFGNQTVGSTSTQMVSTLTNNGNVTLTIASMGVTGTNRADFAEMNTCGASVPVGGSCTISVTFTPAATGTRTASVSVTDNARNNPQSVPLRGAGVLPTVTLTPTSLIFPDQVVFTSSKAQKVTLANPGPGILTITSIAASGQFSQTNTCGTMVKPKAKCMINVTFKPTTKGSLTGSVSISDNAPGSPQAVTLNGTGTYVKLNPASLNFGNQPVGTQSLSKRITLTNEGSVTVNLAGISITGTNASDFAQTNTCGTSVASGASCFINVIFTPSTQGSRTAQVSISDDGGGSPQVVGLAGMGTP